MIVVLDLSPFALLLMAKVTHDLRHWYAFSRYGECAHCCNAFFPRYCPANVRSIVGFGFHRYSRFASFNYSKETQCILRSEPSSRTALIGEQPNPWDLLQPQDATSRHRGAKPPRRCGLLGEISLLSPG